MGSGSSKTCRGSSAEAVGETDTRSASGSGGERRRRSRIHWTLPSSCLSSTSASHDSDDEEQVCSSWMRKSHGSSTRRRMTTMEPGNSDSDCYKRELKEKNAETESHCVSSDELELEDEVSESNGPLRNGHPGRSSSSRSLTTPGRILSHFRFNPGNISSRLSRGSSSRSMNASSSHGTASNDREDCTSPSQSTHFNRAVEERSPTAVADMDNAYAGFLDRRSINQDPFERNVRFSRTLSVGRLRDRVLQRSSLSDFPYRLSQPQGSGSEATTSAADDNPFIGHSPLSIHRNLFGIQDYDVQTPHAREGRYQDLLEHRSNFLERRRRIRAQVRALQRLGSRFENGSSHERSCALAGQNQAGARCTCRPGGNHGGSTADETTAGTSISRIVMLAEALFEVLDEIHHQSVVLSSQPSVSSIGSVPAPNGSVDILPVKLYSKSCKEQSEETSQCYICLLEYEEGDIVRTLPCNHDFHRACVDKWLKEIHRVCPLCRGDICRVSQ